MTLVRNKGHQVFQVVRKEIPSFSALHTSTKLLLLVILSAKQQLYTLDTRCTVPEKRVRRINAVARFVAELTNDATFPDYSK